MKKIFIPLIALLAMSSCIVEVDMTPSHVVVGEINEYETKEVINEVWSRNILVYEEYVYHTFLEIEFINTGSHTARNVWAEISFFDRGYLIKAVTIDLPKIYAGDTYIYEFNTGFESLYEYTDYEVTVKWD